MYVEIESKLTLESGMRGLLAFLVIRISRDQNFLVIRISRDNFLVIRHPVHDRREEFCNYYLNWDGINFHPELFC